MLFFGDFRWLYILCCSKFVPKMCHFQIFDFKKCCDHEICIRCHSRSLKVVPFNRLGMVTSWVVTLCVSVVLSCGPVSVHLSVRLSRWRTVSRWLKISDFFVGPVAPSLHPAPVPNSKEIPFSRGAKYKGVEKFWGYVLKSLFILEMVWDRPMVAMKR